MNIAFLFNSDHEAITGNYAYATLDVVLGTGVIQCCSRRKRFSIGDLLTYGYSKTASDFETLTRAATTPYGADFRINDRLESATGKATIFILLIQNMTFEVTAKLHRSLKRIPYYLGAIQVDFSHRLHLVFFRNSLPEKGRFGGEKCALFYSMGDEENSRDIAYIEQLESHGFSVSYEDSGARGTIFDDFDTIEHFDRIYLLWSALIKDSLLDVEEADDLVHSLEEVHPRLFDVLAAAFKALGNADTSEDFSQVALSVRRFLKLLTDTWSPPRRESKGGRSLTDHHVKNRFWAYVSDAVEKSDGETKETIQDLGKRFDGLWDESSRSVHRSDQTSQDIRNLLLGTLRLTADTININIEKAAQPYLAYNDRIREILSGLGENVDGEDY